MLEIQNLNFSADTDVYQIVCPPMKISFVQGNNPDPDFAKSLFEVFFQNLYNFLSSWFFTL